MINFKRVNLEVRADKHMYVLCKVHVIVVRF
jgi:hypothetical protein